MGGAYYISHVVPGEAVRSWRENTKINRPRDDWKRGYDETNIFNYECMISGSTSIHQELGQRIYWVARRIKGKNDVGKRLLLYDRGRRSRLLHTELKDAHTMIE